MARKKPDPSQLEVCEICEKQGNIGDIVPYFVKGWGGCQNEHMWAHSVCFMGRHERYRKRQAEKVQGVR